MKIEIEVNENTERMLRDLVAGEDTLDVVVARAAEVGAAAFFTGSQGHEFTLAYEALTNPDGYTD